MVLAFFVAFAPFVHAGSSGSDADLIKAIEQIENGNFSTPTDALSTALAQLWVTLSLTSSALALIQPSKKRI